MIRRKLHTVPLRELLAGGPELSRGVRILIGLGALFEAGLLFFAVWHLVR